MTQPHRRSLIQHAKKIRFLLLDVDGVLTNGTVYLDGEGREIKAFNIYDGSGIHLARKAGIEVGFLSGRGSPVLEHRARELGVTEVHQNRLDKLEAYEGILKRRGLTDEEVAYVGDDLIDLPLLRRVGLAVSVPNAVREVRREVHWITKKPGGAGAVREVTDLLLSVRKKASRPKKRIGR
jgi:3-deoxy-D-manno-octulosonate 8-phosphate phosphatase (KDO 8-P phosphatase)